MSFTQSQRTIVVVGATGIQGSGVVRALLSDEYGGPWFVRALTQDPRSGKAQKLLSDYQTTDNRLSLVNGYVYDELSLRSAFTGVYGVFAMTSESYPGKLITEEWELKHEINAGRNIISAAKECYIKHLVFSSLPDTVKASDGHFKRIHHMNNKHTIEQLARKELDGFTSLIPAFKEDAIEMMQWAAVAPTDKTCYGAFELEVEQSSEELGLTASSFEDWLTRSGWTGP
ncbi:cinnamoyl- reductase [Fusarium acutatum]|uniref:Cinnamoyl- reductase n=1 Tax=Fusarium acutatum TaxID=78861 RepID=A0A8H4JAZ4_9HYPO|nr:cinnamoyl- reductase [Fusarium acutatum]